MKNEVKRFTGKERPGRGYWATTYEQAPPRTSSATPPTRILTPALTNMHPTHYLSQIKSQQIIINKYIQVPK